jgi:hypothetical protein
LFVSLDGVAEAHRWVFPYPTDEVGKVVDSNTEGADAMLLGRRTSEEWDGLLARQNRRRRPLCRLHQPHPEVRGLDLRRGRKAEEPSWQGHRHRRELHAGRIASEAGIARKLSLLVFPVVVGNGKRLFEDSSEMVALRLIESQAFDNGVLSLRYGPVRSE